MKKNRASKGKNCKMSIDCIEVNESQVLGFIMKDILDFEVVQWWSDQNNPYLMEKQDQMVHIPEVIANKLKLTKVSLNQMENFRVFKQLKLHLQDSKKL